MTENRREPPRAQSKSTTTPSKMVMIVPVLNDQCQLVTASGACVSGDDQTVSDATASRADDYTGALGESGSVGRIGQIKEDANKQHGEEGTNSISPALHLDACDKQRDVENNQHRGVRDMKAAVKRHSESGHTANRNGVRVEKQYVSERDDYDTGKDSGILHYEDLLCGR